MKGETRPVDYSQRLQIGHQVHPTKISHASPSWIDGASKIICTRVMWLEHPRCASVDSKSFGYFLQWESRLSRQTGFTRASNHIQNSIHLSDVEEFDCSADDPVLADSMG